MSDHSFAPLPNAPMDKSALLQWLDSCGYETSTVEHPPLFSVDESQALRGKIEGGHTKNLFLKDKKGHYFLLTAQEDSTVNLKTLHKLLGATGRLSFGSGDKMVEYLGVTPGAVTALGVLNDRDGVVTFAMDQRLLAHDKINCHPMTNEATTTIGRDDLLAVVRAGGHDPLILDLDAPTD